MDKEIKVDSCIKVVGILFIIMMITQKLGYTFKGFQIQLSLIIFPIMIMILMFSKKSYIKSKNLIIYILMVFAMTILIVFQKNQKYSSYYYFIVIYAFFVFGYKFTLEEREYFFNIFINLLFITGIIAIFQFLIQLIGLQYIDIFDYILPTYKLANFNFYFPISYGARIIKSNGWIYLEPSFLSQFMAIGIIIILYQKKLERKQIIQLIVFSLAIITSFSGTGILLLLLLIVPLLNRMNMKSKILLVFGGLLIIYFFINSDYSYSITKRVYEFSSSNSSGSIRFINPFKEAFGRNNHKLLIGNGPGTASASISSNFSCIPKVVYEYGVLVLIIYLFYIFNYFFEKKNFSLITIALLILYLFLGGYLLQPNMVFSIIFINEAIKSLKENICNE